MTVAVTLGGRQRSADGRRGRRSHLLGRHLMIAASTATEITAIAAGFFLLLVLIVAVRSVIRPNDPPAARRFRVGVFVERDREPEQPTTTQEGTK